MDGSDAADPSKLVATTLIAIFVVGWQKEDETSNTWLHTPLRHAAA